MLTPIGNIHRHHLPRPGTIGYIIDGFRREKWTGKPFYWGGRRRRCIAESYGLADSPDYRYSIGIHLVTVRFLDNSEHLTISGIHFAEPEDL